MDMLFVLENIRLVAGLLLLFIVVKYAVKKGVIEAMKELGKHVTVEEKKPSEQQKDVQ